jgi:hypothetical protein
MVLAGGVLFAGCGGENLSGAGGAGGNNGTGGSNGTGGASNLIPCGNASPDPCICGRPDADPMLAAQCQAKTACEAAGGSWVSSYDPDAGVQQPLHCELPDAGFDGNAVD